MAGLTQAEQVATLDARFPTTGATDHIAYSVNGTSEFAGLARTAIGATGWASATAATPSVKANANALASAAATGAGEVSHVCTMSASSGGTQRTDWQPLAAYGVVSVSNKALTSNVATLTTAAPHNLIVGASVLVAGVDATFDGAYVVTAVGSSTTFSYAKVAGNVTSTAASGTAGRTSKTLAVGDNIAWASGTFQITLD